MNSHELADLIHTRQGPLAKRLSPRLPPLTKEPESDATVAYQSTLSQRTDLREIHATPRSVLRVLAMKCFSAEISEETE